MCENSLDGISAAVDLQFTTCDVYVLASHKFGVPSNLVTETSGGGYSDLSYSVGLCLGLNLTAAE